MENFAYIPEQHLCCTTILERRARRRAARAIERWPHSGPAPVCAAALTAFPARSIFTARDHPLVKSKNAR